MEPDAETVVLQTYDPSKADEFKLENEIDPFGAEQTWPTKDEIKAKGKNLHEEYKDVDMGEEPGELTTDVETGFKKPDPKGDELADLADKFDNMQIKVQDGRSQDDFDDDDQDEEFSLGDEYQSQLNKTSYKHEKFTNLEQRERDEMDFPDEVDTPVDIPARERFEKYRSVNNIRTCDWDPYETLPTEYAKIWRFENFPQLRKQSVIQTESEGLPIDGTYIRITLEPCDERSKNSLELLKLSKERQDLIFSTLLPHETKIIVQHFNLKRHDEDQEVIPSKSTMELHVGFRRFLIRPIFSDDYLHTNKAKYYRFLPHDTKAMASAFMPVCFPGSQVILFRRGTLNKDSDGLEIDYESEKPTLVAYGTVNEPDPLKIILKRIVLTGYPIKCKRKRAVIRYMFFNKDDIRYFRPVELYTKLGLRGKIKDSLGTHGLMK